MADLPRWLRRAQRQAVKTREHDRAWVVHMAHWGVRVLAIVMTLALVFTMVNVQQFAAEGHPLYGVQWFIAWLLDPMASLTMVAAIIYEGLLSDYGKPRVVWLEITKWYAGVGTWGMNIWASAAVSSWHGVWLHSIAPGIALGLAQAAPRVRRHMADIIAELETAAPALVEAAPVVPVAPQYARVGPSSWSAPRVPDWATAGVGAAVGSSSLPVPPVVPVPRPEPAEPTVAPVPPRATSTTAPTVEAEPESKPVPVGPVEVRIGVLEWRPAEVPVGVLAVRGEQVSGPVVDEQAGSADSPGAGFDESDGKLGTDEIVPLLRTWIAESAAEGRSVTKRQIMRRFQVTDHRARVLSKLAAVELAGAVSGNGNSPGSDESRAGA